MSALLAVHDLAVVFDTPRGSLRAVDSVSLELQAGETLGLVGESGSGKTVTALAILRLLPRTARVVTGRAFLQQRNLLRASEADLQKLRGRELGVIFQDPRSALHPLLSVGRQLTEVLEVHERLDRRAARLRAAEALDEVGMPEPELCLGAFPHELSGGMCQRVMIAMTLLLRPKVLFADEPTTALDATVQAQILELLRQMQEKHGTGIVLITHDMGVVAGMADRVQVLYSGRVVESAPTTALFRRPLHPYTRALLAGVPRLDGDGSLPEAIPGHSPDELERPSGCAFHPRCTLVQERCSAAVPELAELRGATDRTSACFESATLLARSESP